MEIKRFKAGEVIFEEWTLGGEMYEIKSGSVGIYANYGKAGEQKLTELGAGRIFGELAAIGGGAHAAHARGERCPRERLYPGKRPDMRGGRERDGPPEPAGEDGKQRGLAAAADDGGDTGAYVQLMHEFHGSIIAVPGALVHLPWKTVRQGAASRDGISAMFPL